MRSPFEPTPHGKISSRSRPYGGAMERFAFFVLGLAVVVGLAMPSGNSSQTQLNQQILIASGSSSNRDSSNDSAAGETSISPSYGGETSIERGPGGHFYTNASVNG